MNSKLSSCWYSHSTPVRQDLLVPGLGGSADALLQLAAVLQLLPSLLSLLQFCRQESAVLDTGLSHRPTLKDTKTF